MAQKNLGTQQEIVAALKARGIEATQVSVSRDIETMGLIKVGGRYRAGQGEAGADPELPLRIWVRSVASAGPNIVVVRCQEGTAQGVARCLDQSPPAGVVGTVAGDDTIFVAVASKDAGAAIVRFLKSRIA